MDEPLTAIPEQLFICETIQWTNCTGLDIVEYQPRCGIQPEGFARFRMQVTLMDKEGRPLIAKVVPIEAESIEEAFLMAPDVMTSTQPDLVDDFNEAARKAQQGGKPTIITAAQARAMGDNGNRQQRRADAAQHNRMRFNG